MKTFHIIVVIMVLSFFWVNAEGEFDSIPENSHPVIFKLIGNEGHFKFYPIYLNGSQPFITKDNIVYAPLELLTYLLVEPSVYLDAENKKMQIRGVGGNLYIGYSTEYPTKLAFSTGYFQNEPLWLENGLYLPAEEFLSTYDMDIIWDSVLNIFTVINVPAFDTHEFLHLYSQPWGNSDGIQGIISQAVLPRELGIQTNDNGFSAILIKALSPLNRPIGATIRRADGARIFSTKPYSNCFPEACILENIERIDSSRLESLILISLIIEY